MKELVLKVLEDYTEYTPLSNLMRVHKDLKKLGIRSL